jgi:hypothetical protein
MNQKSFSSIKLTIFIVISIALLGGWIFLAYKSRSYRNELSTIEAEARNKSSENSYLISVKSVLRDSKEDIDVINSRFLHKDSLPEYINLLEGKVAEAGIKADFGSINADQKTFSVRMTGSGSWEKVIDFIAVIDSLPYASKIDNIGIQMNGGSQDANAAQVWNFTLSLTQYLSS